MINTQTTRVRWYLIFWLFLLSAIGFLDRVNISVAGSALALAYHLSNIRLGWVFSSFLVGYALFQTPAGRLADAFGPRRVLALGVIWWGIFTALTASLPLGISAALTLLILIRFLLGTGEAVMYPASNQFVARWIPSRERGIANGWIFAGVGAGAGISPPLITYVVLKFGWRVSFWLCAVIGVIAGVLWYVIARDRPEDHPSVSAVELTYIRSGLTLKADRTAGAEADHPSWRTLFRSRDVLAMTLSYFSFGYVAWIFFSWFYIYLAQARGLNLKATAAYAMLPFLGMALGCPLGGIISDRLTRKRGAQLGRCVLASCAMLIATGFLAFGSLVHSAAAATIVLASGAAALYLAQSSFWSVSADIGDAASGFVSGFMNMGAQLGAATTASLTPWIADRWGWTASFLVAAGLCFVGAFSWLIVNPARTLVAVNTSSSKPVYASN